MKIGISQNGWPVYVDVPHGVRVTVEGRGFWAANTDVALVLADYTLWYHRNIESINLPVKESPGYDDWSRNVRPVRGQTTGYSNHSSDTAWDINSTRHPRGVKGTFTPKQRAAMKARLKRYVDPNTGASVIRLGEFYSSTVDGMHVEINAGSAAVRRVADIIRNEQKEAAMGTKEEIGTEAAKALWGARHKYTAADAKNLGDPTREGEEYSVNVLLRGYTPRAVKTATTIKAGFAALLEVAVAQRAQIEALTKALATATGTQPPVPTPTPAAARKVGEDPLEALARLLAEPEEEDVDEADPLADSIVIEEHPDAPENEDVPEDAARD